MSLPNLEVSTIILRREATFTDYFVHLCVSQSVMTAPNLEIPNLDVSVSCSSADEQTVRMELGTGQGHAGGLET